MTAAPVRIGHSEPPIMIFENVDKKYGPLQVLSGVTFQINRGEVICVIGPSGSGKSTLLRCATALEPLDGGRIVFDGENLSNPKLYLPKIRQRIGMVFQNFELFPHLTVLRNVSIGPSTVRGMSRNAAEDLAMELLKKVGLADKADQHPAALSGGQQQRVAIARALSMEPDIMLFDEPTSALDPETIGEVLSVMKQLANEGVTMVVVTHEMDFAKRVANWVVVFDEGRMIEQGPPQQIFERATVARTREFLSHIGWHDENSIERDPLAPAS